MRLISMPKCNCCKSCCKACSKPILCNPVLKAHYEYWDRIVEEIIDYIINCTSPNWKNYSTLKEWAYPKFNNDCTPFNKGLNDPTIQYLPEPWWGNNGMHPLHSVVINFNPGKAGNIQQLSDPSSGISKISLYNDFINENAKTYIAGKLSPTCQVFPYLQKSNNWHFVKRARKMFDALKNLNPSYPNFNLHNHLSIELIPWHSKSVNSEFYKYVAHNRIAIFEHCIKFAAEAASCICNPILNGVVIVRISSDSFKKCLGGIGGFNYVQQEQVVNKTNYCVFEFRDIPCKTKFVCIWGNSCQNGFPSSKTLSQIFSCI